MSYTGTITPAYTVSYLYKNQENFNKTKILVKRDVIHKFNYTHTVCNWGGLKMAVGIDPLSPVFCITLP